MTARVALLFEQGGWVVVAIAAASLLAWGLIAWEWLSLRHGQRYGLAWIDQTVRQARDLAGRGDRGGTLDRATFEAQVLPQLRHHTLALQRPLAMIALLATTMPLLGLLGTVLGMMQTFESIQTHGAPQTDALAAGIAKALITTQAGLTLAVPVLLAHTYLHRKIRRLIDRLTIRAQTLQGQSAAADATSAGPLSPSTLAS